MLIHINVFQLIFYNWQRVPRGILIQIAGLWYNMLYRTLSKMQCNLGAIAANKRIQFIPIIFKSLVDIISGAKLRRHTGRRHN